MTRHGYKFGVQWIAYNDDPGETDVDNVRGTLTVSLLADLFCKPQEEVARDVVHERVTHGAARKVRA